MAAYGYIVRRNGRVVDAGARIGKRQDLIKELLATHGSDTEVECPFVGEDDSLADIRKDIAVVVEGGTPPLRRNTLSPPSQQRLDKLMAALDGHPGGISLARFAKAAYETLLDYVYTGDPPVDEVAKFFTFDSKLHPQE